MTKKEGNATRTLAMQLVEKLGREEAIDACRRNMWDGVLKIILTGGAQRDAHHAIT